MGRTARSNLPGMPFHLTARVQAREPLLVGVEARIIDMLVEAVRNARMELLAYAVMQNHLHVVVVQGPLPLSALMQPLLRRIALLITRRRNREGHVFERRYRDHACLDPAYLRNVIAYVHLNPVRAGFCTSPDEFLWTSHHEYCGFGSVAASRSAVELGLRLFAECDDDGARRWLAAYHGFLRWRQILDSFSAEDGEAAVAAPQRPVTDGGDTHWNLNFGESSIGARSLIQLRSAALRPDLTKIARAVLDAENRPAELVWLRSGGRERPLVRARQQVISQALTAGYASSRIARFLGISASTVSAVSAARRSVPAGKSV